MTPHPQFDDADERIPFVLNLASAFHAAGYSTHRIEEALEDIAERLGIAGQFFSTPTSIFSSFGADQHQRTFMLRTRPMPPDLGRMVRVTEIARSVLRGEQRPASGTAELTALAARSEPADLATVAAFGLASGSAARFLGGAGPEVAVAGMAGLVIGFLALGIRRLPNGGRVFELAAASLCSFAVAALGAKVPGFSVPIATLAGLIVLVPGLTLTTAITEIAYDHLSAGTARMAGAFMTFIGIGFGVALGSRVAASLAGHAAAHTPPATPDWTAALALIVSASAFAILLRADRRDITWIVIAAAVAFMATRLGSRLLGPELGVFVGALAIGLGSNLFNRLTERPAVVTLVPGLLTLVPGSVGYRSITALLENQVVAGIDTAFTMVLTAVSLVAGLLTATAIFPERKIA
jgi:uncharacterized membrane protein YjjP (DUF1212 family)